MHTVITRLTLKPGAAEEWDGTMSDRLKAAEDQPGWIGGQLLIPLDRLDKRMIVGTWENRAAWEAWHQDPTFAETRKRLEGLETGKNEHWWHEVIQDVRPAASKAAR